MKFQAARIVLGFILVGWTNAAPTTCRCEDLSRVFSDFDGTIAVNNTILDFAEAVYKATPPGKQTLPALPSLLAEYETNITKASEEFGPQNTIAEEVAFESSSLRRNVDVTLFDQVQDSGMIQYLNASILESVAKKVGLRDGFWEWATAAQRCGPITVLSDNFSTQWLRLVLRTSYASFLSKRGKNHHAPDLADRIEIYCSEILDKQLVRQSLADHPTAIHSGGDKFQLLKKLVGGHVAGTLYLGNTVDDLPVLVGASHGLLIGNDQNLTTMLQKEGAKPEPLVDEKSLQEREPDLILTSANFDVLASIYEGAQEI